MDDENVIPEPSLEESIAYLIRGVPAPVRNFILNDLPAKTQQLMDKYQLHIDQGGLLERELLLMLLGQEQPTDFIAALNAAGIPANVVQTLTIDVNAEIFMKLHQQEAAAAYTPAVAPKPVPPPAAAPWPLQPQASAPVPTPAPVAAPAPQPAPKPYVPPAPAYMAPQPVAAPTPVPPPAPQPMPVPAPVVPPPPSVSQFAATPIYPTSPAPAPKPYVPPAATPYVPPAPVQPAPTRAPAPSAAPAVPVMHTMAQDMAAAQHQPIPVVTAPPVSIYVPPVPQAPVAAPAPATQASANRDALHAVLKEYGVDPYREPPE